MKSTETMLTSNIGDLLFGDWHSFGEKTVESLFRYISIKHGEGDNPCLVRGYALGYFSNAKDINFANTIKELPSQNINILLCSTEESEISKISCDNSWVELNTPQAPMSEYLSKTSLSRAFCNFNERKTFIVANSVNDEWMRRFCSVLFKLLPWIYVNGKVPDDEVEIFRLFSQKSFDGDRFAKIVNEAAEKFGVRDLSLKKALQGWENSITDILIEEKRDAEKSYLSTIRRAEEDLATYLNALSRVQKQLEALISVQRDETDRVYQFFKSHKQLHIVDKRSNSEGSVLRFAILDTIEFYDFDVFKAVYDNPRSPLGRAPKVLRELFWGLYGLNKGVIKAEAVFDLTNLSSLLPVYKVTSGEHALTHIRHPHLYHHACLGGNKNYILKYMKDGDWDLAIEQAIASVKNINFGDSVVLGEFVQDLAGTLSDGCRYIVADNGVEMTASQFLDYIKNDEMEDITNG